MRRKNLNALERIEYEQVSVTRDNVGCVATDGEFEELVVAWITTSFDLYIHIDPLSLARQGREKNLTVFLIDISVELFPAQNFVNLSQRRKRKQHFPFRSAKSRARRGFESGRSNALTRTFVSNTQRNYAQLGAL